jgi:uncharacterized protein YjlB
LSPGQAICHHGAPGRRSRDADKGTGLFAPHGWLGLGRWDLLISHGGRRFQVHRGDVLVVQAGTGLCSAGLSDDLLVMGCRNGMRWDLRRDDPTERYEILSKIAAIPLPNPVYGLGSEPSRDLAIVT